MSNGQSDTHTKKKNATKKFDYTAIANRKCNSKYESTTSSGRELMAKIIVFKRRSNFKVTRSKTIVRHEKSCHKKCTYEIPTSSGKTSMAKVIFFKVGQTSCSRPLGQKSLCSMISFVNRIAHVKYKSPVYTCSKIMTKVKGFFGTPTSTPGV